MSKPKKPFDFKSLKINISLESYGSDYLPFDISGSIFERFPDQIKYDKSLTFIFYPSYAYGTIGLIYCFSDKLDRSIGNTYYFGWGAVSSIWENGGLSFGDSELFLFSDEEHTTDYNKAEETMYKYILQKRT